jgi:biofilm PGA synthesis lipoprotein PgaB
LQTRDWSTPQQPPLDSRIVAAWMRQLLQAGAQNIAYYPDDFVQNQPMLNIIRPAISTGWYPYR